MSLESHAELTSSIEDKILHILHTYPKISPSHLQLSLGSSLPTMIWKPVLERLISDGKVTRHQTSTTAPNGRSQTCIIIGLASTATTN